MQKVIHTRVLSIVLSLFLSEPFESFSQNIAVNTDGSSAETGVMLDIKGTNPKATAANETLLQLGSNNATANQLKLRLILGGGAAGVRQGTLEVYDEGASAYRHLALQPNGGKVGIGTAVPGWRLHVKNTDPAVIVGTMSEFSPSLAADQGVNLHASWSEVNTSSAFNFNCTLWAAVNRITTQTTQTGSVTATVGSVNDVWHNGTANMGSGTGMKGSFLNGNTSTVTDAYGIYSDIWNSGGGTITNAYGLYVGTIQGTNKWGIYSVDGTAQNYFAGNTGIGTTTPGAKLEVAGQVKITGGSPGSGKILTSDASGLASWSSSFTPTSLTYVSNTSETESTTLSTSFVNRLTMTVGAGTWMITVYAEQGPSGSFTFARLTSGGTEVINPSGTMSNQHALTGMTIQTYVANTTVAVQYRSGDGVSNASLYRARMIAIRIA